MRIKTQVLTQRSQMTLTNKVKILMTDDNSDADDCSKYKKKQDIRNKNHWSQKRFKKMRKNVIESSESEKSYSDDNRKNKQKSNKTKSKDESDSKVGGNSKNEDTLKDPCISPKKGKIEEMKDTGTSGKKFGETFTDPITHEKMIYIKHDFSFKNDDFSMWMEKKTESLFTKAKICGFYKSNELIKRCLKENPNVRTPNGGLRYYIYKRVTKDNNAIKTKLEQMNHYFTEQINTCRKDCRKNNK
ncbi:uncharacterized protein LOC116416680 [Nasonia vitripennis]|uniref:Uncharacterized protein n=1 Tax=Nasonia vitripennis TaxID=7425 RepID=A0A7M7Q7R2_NASVI|nr:uncharacterized protein LOC116416680 [Nasonia vitripennis]